MKKALTFLASLICLSHLSAQVHEAAERKPILLGIADEIHSYELDENRTLNIYLPPGYNGTSDTTYPVIYLLDGSENEDYIHIVGLVQFLHMIDTLPGCIIVGIANVNRKRDFTFPTTVIKDKEAYPTTGGSEKFIAFVEKELQPYIDKKYKVSASKTLVGQSLGGLLATEILLRKPALFDRYLIVSPSLWWDNESLLTKALNSSAPPWIWTGAYI
jgi:predicted alpha/beta superfamily hydrolase